jgi:hypothetical protein
MSGSWSSCFIRSFTVPLSKAVRPLAITFRVLFCIGVGWFVKSCMYGVTQQDAPESIIACEISFVQALLAISIVIMINALFLSCDLF